MEDKEEESNHIHGGGSTLDRRATATVWAQSVLKENPRVKAPDRPYIEAALVEAALMEYPLKELAVGINDCGQHYKITLKGYKNLLDDVLWVNAFHGAHRNAMLDNVTKSYTQLTDSGAIKVIQINKVQLNNLRGPNASDPSQGEESSHPAASSTKRLRKRAE